jgi:hypothetical protein
VKQIPSVNTPITKEKDIKQTNKQTNIYIYYLSTSITASTCRNWTTTSANKVVNTKPNGIFNSGITERRNMIIYCMQRETTAEQDASLLVSHITQHQ